MNLDEAQRHKIAEWIAHGLKLSEIQDRLASEFGLRLTYMEVRLLVDDLKLIPKDAEPSLPPQPILPPSFSPPRPQAPRTPPSRKSEARCACQAAANDDCFRAAPMRSSIPSPAA